MFGRSKRKPSRSSTGAVNAEEQREEELHQWRERHLPWEAENKVTAMFSIVKLPLILFVGFFGIVAEKHVKELSLQRWSRSALSGQPSCYVHKLDIKRAPKHTEWSLVQFLNSTFMGGHLGEPKELTVADVTVELAGRDLCGFNEHCKPDSSMKENKLAAGGVQHGFSFALLWTLFKLAFIGVHPLDRVVVRMFGLPPLLKLLTEPYFRPPCTKPMALLVKAFFYIRYKVMPNLLLGSLASLETHPVCPDLIHYRMDWFWGNVMYYAIVLDFLITAGLYGAGIYFGVNPVGTWRYRFYKLFWFFTGLFPAVFCFFDVMTTSQWNIFRLIRFTFRVIFTFDVTFAFYIDFLQLFLAFIVLLEFIEFIAFLCQILCPRFLERQPWFKAMDFEWCDPAPNMNQGESEDAAQLLVAGSEDSPAGSGAASSVAPAPAPAASSGPAPPVSAGQTGPNQSVKKQLGQALKGAQGLVTSVNRIAAGAKGGGRSGASSR